MGYVESSLGPGESVRLRARPHWGIFVGPVLWMGAGGVFLLLLLLGILMASTDQELNAATVSGFTCFILLYLLVCASTLASAAAQFFSTEFAVTDRRIIAKTGLLRRKSLELVLAKVESIGVDQPLFGRILNYGTIVVSGSGGTKQRFPNISNPMRLKNQVNEMLPRST